MNVLDIVLVFVLMVLTYVDFFTKPTAKNTVKDTGSYDDGCLPLDATIIPITKYEIAYSPSYGWELLIYTPREYFNVDTTNAIKLNSQGDSVLGPIDGSLFWINAVRNWDPLTPPPLGNPNCLSLKSVPESVLSTIGSTSPTNCSISVQISSTMPQNFISAVKVDYCTTQDYLQMKIEGPMDLHSGDQVTFESSGTQAIDTWINGRILQVDALHDYNYVCVPPGPNPDAIRVKISSNDYHTLGGGITSTEYIGLHITYTNSQTETDYAVIQRPRPLYFPSVTACSQHSSYIEIVEVQFFRGILGKTNVIRFRVLDPAMIPANGINPGTYVFLKLSSNGDYELSDVITALMNDLDHSLLQVKTLTKWNGNVTASSDTLEFDYPVGTGIEPSGGVNGDIAFFSASVYTVPSCAN